MTDANVTGLEAFAAEFPPAKGRALVVGSKCYGDKPDRRKHYRKAVGVDLFAGDGVDIVHDLETPLPESLGLFDHVDCVSVLEHVQRPWLLAENIERALKPGGSILISVPFAWRVHAYPSDFWRMTIEAFPILFPNVEWRMRRYLVDGKLRKLGPTMRDGDGNWIARCESVGMGYKCASTS